MTFVIMPLLVLSVQLLLKQLMLALSATCFIYTPSAPFWHFISKSRKLQEMYLWSSIPCWRCQ